MKIDKIHTYTHRALTQAIHNEEDLAVFRMRLKYIFIALMLCFIVLIIKLTGIHLREHKASQSSYTIVRDKIVKRADIVDRNGVLLASNLHTASLYANPGLINEPKKLAKALVKNIIGLSYSHVLKQLSSGKNFVWLKRHLSPKEQEHIYYLGHPALQLIDDERRVYPQKELFSHIIGYSDIDGKGIAGAELYFENWLTSEDNIDTPLELSLDTRIQYALHDILRDTMNLHEAEGIAGIVMDPNNGEVVAMSSLPDFDPHHLAKTKSTSLFNFNTMGVYEPGSTLKLLTMAIALDTDALNVNDIFDVSQPIKIGKFTVKDYRRKRGIISTPEILTYSSNIGIVQVGNLIGPALHKEYLSKMGLLRKLDIELPEQGAPMYPANMWNEVNSLTISYGHGIAISPLHLSTATSAIVNGGVLFQPTILKGAYKKRHRIIKPQTSKMMRKMMHLVVTQGYGKKAALPGYFIGGKTGTAEKVRNGKYDKSANNIASFIGAFPIDKPQYVVLIIIDAAKPNAINRGFTTGGMIAAPAAGKLMAEIARINDIPPNIRKGVIKEQLYVEHKPNRPVRTQN